MSVATGRTVTEQVRGVLMGYVSSISAESVLKSALRRAGRSTAQLDREGVDDAVIAELGRGLAFFLSAEAERKDALTKLASISRSAARASLPTAVEVVIGDEGGVVEARTLARSFARDMGFDRTDQAKIATAVSELARNIYAYARSGRVHLAPLELSRSGVRIVATDTGPGIPNLAEILEGNYRSRTGMGLGILACKRLMDEFSIVSEPGRGTTVTIAKYLA